MAANVPPLGLSNRAIACMSRFPSRRSGRLIESEPLRSTCRSRQHRSRFERPVRRGAPDQFHRLKQTASRRAAARLAVMA